MTCWLSFLVSQSTERTRLLGRGIDQNAQTHESFELAYERNAEPSTNPEPNPTDRSIEEIGIDAALEPALGRKTWKGLLILILTPLLLSPLPIVIPNVASRAGYGILIIIVYWVTEVCPLAVTSTLPLIMFPLLGVLSSSEVAASYMTNANILFVGGLLVFVSFEEWNLHKRIALKALLLIGTKKQNLLFGFMLTTAGISMLLSNTATTAMMVQIVKVILAQLELGERRQDEASENDRHQSFEGSTQQESTVSESGTDFQREVTLSYNNEDQNIQQSCQIDPTNNRDVLKEYSRQDDQKQFAKALMIAIAFSANIGGIATLTGTGTNMIFAGQATKLFPKSNGVSFASWFGFAFPLMVILLVVGWVYLVIMFLGTKSAVSCFSRRQDRSSIAIYEIIKTEYASLGKMRFAEKAVLGHLIVLVLLWLTKDPQFVTGWASFFKKGYVSDGTIAMLVSFSLFQFPSLMKENHARVYSGKLALLSSRPLLDLQMISEKLCWNVLVLLGGGFAVAAACQSSGLSVMISEKFEALKGVPDYAVVSVICFTTTAVTEVLSNTGTATIFLPVLASLATSMHIHPWYLMIPATISCSFAFMFPVSTPANAIVYSTGRIKMWDMVKAGIGMDGICLAVLLMFTNLYGTFYFNLKKYPSWALPDHLMSTLMPTNATILYSKHATYIT